jgi:hypothetical protein
MLALLADDLERLSMLIADLARFLCQSPKILRVVPGGLRRGEVFLGNHLRSFCSTARARRTGQVALSSVVLQRSRQGASRAVLKATQHV